jgi:hypothetical protein
MKYDLSESSYRIILFVALYLLSALMIFGFLYLDGSAELKETLKKVDNHSTSTGFKFYALVGILQYGLLIAGISIFGALTFVTIKKRL